MEFKSLRSKALPVSLALASLFVVGCGDPEKLNLAPKPVFDITVSAKAPDFGDKTNIQLKNGREELQVGDDLRASSDFYAKPPKAYEFREMPAAFGVGYKSQGWESDLEGFGIISYQNQVAVAMRLFHKVDDARVQNEVTSIRYRAGRELGTVEGRTARYWFWESKRHRQMVCAVPEGKDTYMVTIAIGELNAMDALRMNPTLAAADAKRADRTPAPSLTE